MRTERYKEIRKRIADIIRGTEWEGRIYLVGGCVRDEIMQMEIHDVDIAVDAPNGGVRFAEWLHKNRFTAGRRPPLIFVHFGTAKVRIWPFGKDIIDCVQLRKTKYIFEKHPHPEANFGTIVEDAMCRDLTINSLYVNVSTGELLDPTGMGRHDIKHHIIRTPNAPDISLRDNAMHILRCIRFSVRYGWKLTPALIDSMKRNLDILGEATPTRMTKELTSTLQLKRRDVALHIIEMIGAMPYVEPYLKAMQEGRPAPNPFARKRRHSPRRRPRQGEKKLLNEE